MNSVRVFIVSPLPAHGLDDQADQGVHGGIGEKDRSKSKWIRTEKRNRAGQMDEKRGDWTRSEAIGSIMMGLPEPAK